jgi:hypothetical protein
MCMDYKNLKDRALLKGLKPSGSFKNIHGRKIELYENGDTFRKKIRFNKGRGSSQINIPKFYEGDYADVKILILKPFTCKICLEAFDKEQEFSPEKDVCTYCFNRLKKLEDFKKFSESKKVCLDCGKPLSDKEFEENWCQQYHFETCGDKEYDKFLSESLKKLEQNNPFRDKKKIRGKGKE